MFDRQFLTDNPVFQTNYITADQHQCEQYFTSLLDIAEQDIPLAHCISKCTSVRNDLTLSRHTYHNTIARTAFVGCQSVWKPFDTVTLTQDLKLVGKKHFVSNLPIGEYATLQISKGDTKWVVYVDLNTRADMEYTYNTITGPGMLETQTGEIEFVNKPIDETCLIMEVRQDPRWDLRESHNHFFFTTNFFGASKGLFKLIHKPVKFSYDIGYLDHLWQTVLQSIKTDVSSDKYWTLQNTAYIASKRLLSELVCEIISNWGGEFMGSSNPKGKYFYDALVFSCHRGAYGKVKDRHMLAR
jgi:hypothetical protein